MQAGFGIFETTTLPRDPVAEIAKPLQRPNRTSPRSARNDPPCATTTRLDVDAVTVTRSPGMKCEPATTRGDLVTTVKDGGGGAATATPAAPSVVAMTTSVRTSEVFPFAAPS
jgi:hypothetical protein